jgi:hypothetical protein
MKIQEFQEQITVALCATGLAAYTPDQINETMHPEDELWKTDQDILIVCTDMKSKDESILFPGFILKVEDKEIVWIFEACSIIPPGPVYRDKSLMSILNQILSYYKNLQNLDKCKIEHNDAAAKLREILPHFKDDHTLYNLAQIISQISDPANENFPNVRIFQLKNRKLDRLSTERK